MTHRVGFNVFDGVTMLDVTGPAEVLQQADRRGHPYDLTLHSPHGGQARTSTGIPLSGTVAAAEAGHFDTVLVAGGDLLTEHPPDTELPEATRTVAARATRVASVCTDAFVPNRTRPAGRAPRGHPLAARHIARELVVFL